MKVLVIDRNVEHLAAAKRQLQEKVPSIEIVTVQSYDQVEKQLGGLLPDRELHGEECDHKNDFDYILSGMYLPASKQGVPEVETNCLVPYGPVIALTAIALDIPIAIVSEKKSCDNPLMRSMEMVLQSYYRDPRVSYEGVHFIEGEKDELSFEAHMNEDETSIELMNVRVFYKGWDKALSSLLIKNGE